MCAPAEVVLASSASSRGRCGRVLSHRLFPAFVAALSALLDDAAYDALRERFGVRRTHAGLWEYNDRAHSAHSKLEPIEFGLFDYNRLDSR